MHKSSASLGEENFQGYADQIGRTKSAENRICPFIIFYNCFCLFWGSIR